MKARQARSSSGVPMFFVSSKEGKKGLFYRSSSNEDYIDPDLGKIHVESGKDGKNVYVQYFEDLTGYITDIKVKKTFREMPGKGKVPSYDITIEMESGDSPIRIMFGFDSGYGRKFAQRFRSIKLKEEVTIKPYNFIPKGNEKAVLGVNVYRGDSRDKEDIYPAYYDKDNMPSFESDGRDGPEFDSKAANNWLYKKFIEDVYHAFDHYEEEEKPEDDDRGRHNDKYDPGNRKDYRDNMDADRKSSGRDDDRRSSRDDDRDERRSSRDDDRRDSGRSDERRSSRDDDDRRSTRDDERRPSRDDDRRSSRDDDRKGREDERYSRTDDDDEYDRSEKRETRRSDNKSGDEIPQRRQRDEIKTMSKEEFEAERRAKSGDSRPPTKDNYSATGGMEGRRGRKEEDDDLPF